MGQKTGTQRRPLKLVLYSGGQSPKNHLLHCEVARLARAYRSEKAKRRQDPLSLTYIPYMEEGAELFFTRAMRRYRSAGIERFYTLEPNRRPHPSEIKILLQSDVIYLAGGNTYTFLHHLRSSGLLPVLKRFANQGGVLAGLSAGAILLTPTISLAGIPSYDVDENEVGLTAPAELKALDLVPFEFSPHDTKSNQRQRELLEHSTASGNPIFSMRDGAGLVVEGKRVTAIGEGKLYIHGKVWKIRR
jgi:dipeptidase E